MWLNVNYFDVFLGKMAKKMGYPKIARVIFCYEV